MARAVWAHPLAGKMLREGGPELTMKWTDPETGLICKGRADYFDPSVAMAIDVKSTEDASPHGFARSVANYGYHRQNAFYDDGFEACGAPLEHFVFIAVEKRAPYLVGLYNLDEADVSLGREWTRRNLDRLAECVERGDYPGYSQEIETLSLPRWTT